VIDESFRLILPRFVGPILKTYEKLGLSPNVITIFGFIFSCVSAVMIVLHLYLPAVVIWWLGRLLDGTDGIYARTTNQTSDFGAFLDILCDMASYSVMILGFSFAFPHLQSSWIIIISLYVLCITGALSLGNFEEKKKIPSKNNRGLRLASGIAEGGETGIAYTLFLLFPKYLEFLVVLWICILFLTVLARLILAKKELV
jgi:phosphatidylglycerophosphate synthase